MRKTLRRSNWVLFVGLAVIVGLCLFIFRISINASQWIQHTYNGHLAGANGLANAGVIYDRKGVVLAYSQDNQRLYCDDYTTRLSTLHTVGDDSLNISSAIQSSYRSHLTGFNYIWGMGLPESINKGNDITLNVYADACNSAYNALNGKNGAVIVYNYKTGEVLCSVSTPTYDPMSPPEITEENESEYDGVYVDKVFAGLYAPGSTFKIVTTAAAFEYIPNIESRTFTCNGSIQVGDDKITCMDNHGEITMKEGLAKSCNIVFAELSIELGKNKMTAMANKLGFNSRYIINGTKTANSNFNVAKADKNQLGWAGIGQYTVEANPMQMAIMCGAIANGGTTVTPFLTTDPLLNGFSMPIRLMEPDIAEKLDEYMRYSVTDYYGDGMFPSLNVCAKTGTAEVGNDKEPHAWIVGYAQDEDVPLAFAVIVENGGYGYSTAGPVAVSAMEACANIIRGY